MTPRFRTLDTAVVGFVQALSLLLSLHTGYLYWPSCASLPAELRDSFSTSYLCILLPQNPDYIQTSQVKLCLMLSNSEGGKEGRRYRLFEEQSCLLRCLRVPGDVASDVSKDRSKFKFRANDFKKNSG